MLRKADDRGAYERGDRDVQQRLAMRVQPSWSSRDPGRDRNPEQRDGGHGAHHASVVVQHCLQQPIIGQRENAPHVIEEPARDGQVEGSIAQA